MVDERIARRERRRRQIRRRRILAGGALLLAAVIVAAVAGTSRGHHRGSTHNGPRRRGSNRTASRPPMAGWRPHTGPVPILEYHVLGASPADAPYPDLYVTRPDFHREMAWLDGHGYEAVTLEQVEDAWYRGATLPPKPVVLSFDDGYRPQFTYALPELRRHGWAGVLNLKAEGSDLYPSNVEAMIAPAGRSRRTRSTIST
jgi:hypothetical protein